MPALAITQEPCPVCKRPIGAHHTIVELRGLKFHAYCAGYKRRAAAA